MFVIVLSVENNDFFSIMFAWSIAYCPAKRKVTYFITLLCNSTFTIYDNASINFEKKPLYTQLIADSTINVCIRLIIRKYIQIYKQGAPNAY